MIDLSVDFLFWLASSLLILVITCIVVVILRRAFRRQSLFTESDWRFLFGRSKEEVLSLGFWTRFGLAVVVCSLIGAAEYMILLPYGEGWYLTAVVLTFVGVIFAAARYVG